MNARQRKRKEGHLRRTFVRKDMVYVCAEKLNGVQVQAGDTRYRLGKGEEGRLLRQAPGGGESQCIYSTRWGDTSSKLGDRR